MMSDNDGIDDALRNAAQLTAGMLARLGEAQSRASQQRVIDQEHALAAASARAEQRTQQADAQEQAALARLRLVHDPNWWTAATARQVGDTWQIADAYRGHPEGDAAREVMAREITARWGVTPGVDADGAAVRRLLEQAEHAQQQAQTEAGQAERGRALAAREEIEHAAQQAHAPVAPQPDTSAEPGERDEPEQARVRDASLDRHSEDGYDSGEQRQARAEGYAKSGNQRATQARILADEGNGLPPTFATRSRASRRRRPSRGPHQPRPYYRIVADRGR